ncbi:MAG TPA: siderophore-interacting protein [Pirellulales bacterium]|jgi:NADPH-dependent ferric siderophore reductase
MNDRRFPVSPESMPPAGKGPGLIESAFQKLFTRQSRVESIEELNAKFRLITLSGDALKKVTWTPGDKLQVQLGGWVQRTYTPLDWISEEGRTRILIYLHADGPGTGWARSLRVGDACTLFGPRRSINLTQLRRPAIFFGDETTFGLARALRSMTRETEGVEFLFEVSTPSESLPALEHLGLTKAQHCVRADGEAHLPELETRMLELLDSHHPAQFVLAGRSTAIQRLRQVLRQRGCYASQFHTRAYWAPGKKGLD